MMTHHHTSPAVGTMPEFHTVTWQSPTGAVLTVEIYDTDDITLYSPIAITLTLDELTQLRDDCVRYLYNRKNH